MWKCTIQIHTLLVLISNGTNGVPPNWPQFRGREKWVVNSCSSVLINVSKIVDSPLYERVDAALRGASDRFINILDNSSSQG